MNRLCYVEAEQVSTKCEMLASRDTPNHLLARGRVCLHGLCNAGGGLICTGCPGPAPPSPMDLLHRIDTVSCHASVSLCQEGAGDLASCPMGGWSRAVLAWG